MMKEIEEAGLISIDEVDNYETPLIKLHFTHASGAEWHVVAGDKLEDGDWLFFGIGKITMQELGQFTLNELLSVDAKLDKSWKPLPMSEIFKLRNF